MEVLKDSQENALGPPFPHCAATTQFSTEHLDQLPKPAGTIYVTYCFSGIRNPKWSGASLLFQFNGRDILSLENNTAKPGELKVVKTGNKYVRMGYYALQ